MAGGAGRYATQQISEHVVKGERAPQVKLRRQEKLLMDIPPSFELCDGEEATSVSKTVINKGGSSISFEQTVTTTVMLKKRRLARADDHERDHGHLLEVGRFTGERFVESRVRRPRYYEEVSHFNTPPPAEAVATSTSTSSPSDSGNPSPTLTRSEAEAAMFGSDTE